MSNASSDDGSQEPGNSQENFQSAQPIQAAEPVSHWLSKREADVEDADPLTITPNLGDQSDPDEYLPPPISSKRKGKQPASENAYRPLSGQDTIQAETNHDRPNRFYGPPSTWLSWTQSERETIKALDQERNENLSAHLYVAHKIKKHARSVQQAQSRRGKDRVTSTDDDEARKDDEKPFVPPKVWTAWPMPPEQVPRVFHTTGILDQDDRLTIKGPQDLRPSAELEECLIATITRIARERWDRREWEDDHESDGLVPGWGVARSKVQTSRQTAATPYSRTQRKSSSPPVFFSSQPVAQRSPSPPPQTHPTTSRPEFSPSPHSTSRSLSPPQLLPPQASLEPVPTADDDRAHTLLLPATRHIISRLNDLLLGLHRARTAYAGGHANRNGDETQTETEAETSKSRSRGRRKAESRKGERKNNSLSRAVLEEEDTYTEAQSLGEETNLRPSPSIPNPHPPSRRKRPHTPHSNPQASKLSRLNPRDWSDVLGMAALTGWDRDVVLRAGERCARLFGEGMGFRTFQDPGVGDPRVEGEKGGFEEVLVSGRGFMRNGEGDREEDEDRGSDGDGDGSDKIDVMHTEDQDHASTTALSPRQETSTDSSSPSSPPHSAAAAKPNPTEPSAAQPFKSEENPPHRLSASNPEQSPRHEEAIFCPVHTCARHRLPFSRGNLLYQHVRRVHPQVDLGVVKEGQRRRRRSVSRGRLRGGKEGEEGLGG